MHSDWEQRSSTFGTGVEGGVDGIEMNEANRELGLRQPLTGLTTGIISGALVSESSDVPTMLYLVPFLLQV